MAEEKNKNARTTNCAIANTLCIEHIFEKKSEVHVYFEGLKVIWKCVGKPKTMISTQ